MVECIADGCELPLRRKDSTQGCLHYGVSCLACRAEMQKCHLETHWRTKCPDREITCELCKSKVYYRDLAEHNSRKCHAIGIRCPGEALGCTVKNKRGQAEIHAESCVFAKLAPLFAAQNQRMDEQEAAQKQMSRKLEVLENGFASMHSMLYPKPAEDPDQTSADPSSIPLLHGHGSEDEESEDEAGNIELGFAPIESFSPRSRSIRRPTSERPNRAASEVPGPRPADIPEPFSPDFDLASPFPPPATNGPYASPLHHMLSMHESLRDEMSRVNSALQELDGRHSMQIINENMRTREEITYMGAQVAGLSRQVHWLTSAQLQRQSRTPTPGAAGTGDLATAGPSVEAAINSAVRGAARMVGAGSQSVPAMRRGPSEEGRTKL
ncbi:TRAF-type zinc finger [Lecanosticta acicola]|uniref:TRAF-type zinc finger n=1 Tax=Lecanosticta acicola TaxID=111012 RepID=A0AAI9ECM9_9PEZI|nr:TRAF-type zinc finger [Lecanosticta acicola]